MSGAGDIREARIESLAAGGDGVCRLSSKVCFVPGGVPGDLLEIRIEKDGKKASRGRIERILEPSAHRREPGCSAFGMCGGCAWLHVSYGAQLEAKRGFVARALGMPDVEIAPSPAEMGYRRLARLHWDPARSALGFAAKGARSIVGIDRCQVLEPALSGCLPPLADGPLRELRTPAEVRLSGGAGEIVAAVEIGAIPSPEFYAAARQLVPASLKGIAVDADGFRGEIGRPKLEGPGVDGRTMIEPAGGFGQANDGVNRELAATVGEWISGREPGVVLELFAGVGNLSVILAPLADKLVTVELDDRARACGEENMAARGHGHVRVVGGDALEEYGRHGKRARTVVLDPPRTGHRDLAREMARGDHHRIIYVSCDPATLGRDLAHLAEGGYSPVEARAFDMFPQTPHVEAAVLLEKER